MRANQRRCQPSSYYLYQAPILAWHRVSRLASVFMSPLGGDVAASLLVFQLLVRSCSSAVQDFSDLWNVWKVASIPERNALLFDYFVPRAEVLKYLHGWEKGAKGPMKKACHVKASSWEASTSPTPPTETSSISWAGRYRPRAWVWKKPGHGIVLPWLRWPPSLHVKGL